MHTITVDQGRVSILSKETETLIGRVSEQGPWFWNKQTKAWELFTWEELQGIVEAHKAKPVAV